MMMAEPNDEMDRHWMAALRAAFSAWMELQWVTVGACHSWTRSPWLRTTNPETAVLDSISNQTICEYMEVSWGIEARA